MNDIRTHHTRCDECDHYFKHNELYTVVSETSQVLCDTCKPFPREMEFKWTDNVDRTSSGCDLCYREGELVAVLSNHAHEICARCVVRMYAELENVGLPR